MTPTGCRREKDENELKKWTRKGGGGLFQALPVGGVGQKKLFRKKALIGKKRGEKSRGRDQGREKEKKMSN